MSEPESCPNCPDQGWYVVAVMNHNTGEAEPEQEQCEFCYSNENSVFNQKQEDEG